MRRTRSAMRRQSQCQHTDITITVTAGMRRTVCDECGHVSVGLMGESITRGAIPSARYEVDTRAEAAAL